MLCLDLVRGRYPLQFGHDLLQAGVDLLEGGLGGGDRVGAGRRRAVHARGEVGLDLVDRLDVVVRRLRVAAATTSADQQGEGGDGDERRTRKGGHWRNLFATSTACANMCG